MKKTLCMVLMIALVLSTAGLGWQQGEVQAEEVAQADATVYVDANEVLEDHYLGVGVQWDPQDPTVTDYTYEQWNMITDRVGFMKPPIIRTILQARWYAKLDPSDSQDGIQYYWEDPANWGNDDMERVYAILDYAQANDIEVILGEWSKSTQDPLHFDDSTDPRWMEMMSALIEHMIHEKGYTNIKYWNYINEPNGEWGISDEGKDRWTVWSIGVRRLHEKLKEKGLEDDILIVGPDSTSADNWVDMTADHLPDVVDVYDIHRYATDSDIMSGNIEKTVASKKAYYMENDPYGGVDKPFMMGEAGLADGKNHLDQQFRVYDFEYGVMMSDYINQTMRGGQASIILWSLDDSMHRLDAFDPSSTYKVWGFWHTLGTEEEQALRPWYYTSSLYARNFPRGSQTVFASKSGINNVHVAAAKIPNGNEYDLSFALVNNQPEAKTIKLVMPAATAPVTMNQYNYFENDRPVDANGYPVASGTLTDVDLTQGIDITLPGRGVILLSTLETGTSPIALDENATIPVTGGETVQGYTSVIEDELENFEHIYDLSDGWQMDTGNADLYFEGDASRIKRGWDNAQHVTYQLNDMDHFEAKFFYNAGTLPFDAEQTVKFYTSPDGTTWEPMPAQFSNPSPTADGWMKIVYTPGAKMPANTAYLKLEVLPDGDSGNDGNSWTPQLAYMKLTRTLVDTLENFNKMYDYGGFQSDSSNPDYFNGDTSRMKRTSSSSEAIVYRLNDIGDFKVDAGYQGTLGDKVTFDISPDGENWTPIGADFTEPQVFTDWYLTSFTPNEVIPVGTNYLRIWANAGGEVWDPQIMNVTISPVAKKLVDGLDNWQHIASHSDGWSFDNGNAETYFEGDASRLKRTALDQQEIVYHFTGLDSFSANVYGETGSVDVTSGIDFYTSTDGANWSVVDAVYADGPVPTADNWARFTLKSQAAMPEGTNYLKLVFSETGGNPWSPQLSEVTLISGKKEDKAAPTAPANLRAATYGASYVNLEWDASIDDIGVEAYQVFDGGVLVATVAETSVQLSDLEANSAHDYTVVAVDGTGKTSAASDVLQLTLKSVVSVDQVSFTDYNGTEVTDLNGLSFIKASASVTNNERSDVSTSMIVALYDADGAVQRLSIVEKTLGVDETLTFQAGFDLPSDVTGHEIKVFVWDSLGGMTPYAEPVVFPASS
ncbi:cellulase family glycosylhydrolase [Marinicrinis sediminis]|uniref:Cellulase family glycosylhydrolase n=1 Tax=Marinicrinis sediminis TaxID=1652465 RepID=A0ABW5RG34_9BACL